MEKKVEIIIKKHIKDKDLTHEKIKPGWDWSYADLSDFHLEGLTLSDKDKPANFKCTKFNGAHLSNVIAKGANFEDANLDCVKDAMNADFQYANFYRAFIRNATICYADFTGADLIHVYFDDSNLKGSKFNCADLSNSYTPRTNFSESELYNAKLDGIEIDKAHGFDYANGWADLNESIPESARFIYYRLENYFRIHGYPDAEGMCYYRRKVMQRKIWKQDKKYRNKFRWFLSIIFDILCGYGEKPFNVLIGSFFIIWVYALFYAICVRISGNILNQFWDFFIFSGATFTTLGFGDIFLDSNNILIKILAVSEALFGAFLISLFVVCLTRKLMR